MNAVREVMETILRAGATMVVAVSSQYVTGERGDERAGAMLGKCGT